MIFYRFDEIPKNEKSCTWRGEEKIGTLDVLILPLKRTKVKKILN